MNSFELHPARRKGEVYHTDPGRYLGENCHLDPGRRHGEPNHEVWKDLISMRLTAAAKRTLFSAQEAENSTYFDNSNAENATAMIRAIGDSVAVLKSIVDIMPALERLISVNSGLEAKRRDPKTIEHQTSEKLPPKRPLTNNNGWSADAMIEMHNMCAESRRKPAGKPTLNEVYEHKDDSTDNVIPPGPRYYKPN
jgi:hypothetical protein